MIANTRNAGDAPGIDLGHLELLELLSTPVWIYDFRESSVRWANAEGLKFWNAASLDELQARGVRPETEGGRIRLSLLEAALEREGRVVEQWTLFPSGRPATVECICTRAVLGDGHPAMLIEARIPAENDLGKAELRAVEAIRHTQLMIAMFSREGRVLMRNPAAAALANRLDLPDGADAYLGMFADPVRADRLRRKALGDGEAEAVLEVAVRPARVHHVSLRIVQDPMSGTPVLLVAQQDVSKARRLERRLERALARERETSETQRHFLSIASHEFKTPLSIIDGAAQRILRAAADPDSHLAERVKSIRAAVLRMGHAVDSTLEMTRVSERRIAYAPEPTDLGPILGRACEAQRALDPDRKIDLPRLALPLLQIDPHLTGQVIENILSNAVKYSEPSSPIGIDARIGVRSVTLVVSDRGIGIPEDEQPHLFSRFFRASNARTRPGTGIGLSTVRYFMRLQRGSVRIRSTEGRGTTVELRFPRAK